jgi:hypothetical protein
MWCGNRFAKGLIRLRGTNYPVNELICDKIHKKTLRSITGLDSRWR